MAMLLSKTAKIKWNSKNKKRYTALGYVFTKIKDEFEVNVNDLPDYSKAEVIVKCDYCGTEIKKKWINYVSESKKNDLHKDACKECQRIKAKESMISKYGTSNPMDIEEFRNKQRETSLKKYGYENPSSHPEIRKKVAETNMKRYGGIAPTASDDVKEKVRATCLERYGVENPLAIWDRKGENNPNWKGGVSYEYEGRLSLECLNWKKSVYKKDNYTCQCCGAKNTKGNRVTLNAHHIFNWNDYEDLRYDINNGITLCDKCHINFHREYGRKLNNKEQIDEFIFNHGQKIC